MDGGAGWAAWLADEYERFIKARMTWYPRAQCWLMEGRLIPPSVMDEVRDEVVELAAERLPAATAASGPAPDWSARRQCAEALHVAWNESSCREMLGLPSADDSMIADRATITSYERWQRQLA